MKPNRRRKMGQGQMYTYAAVDAHFQEHGVQGDVFV